MYFRYLLMKGANPRQASRKGNTALHDAVEANHVEICEILLQVFVVIRSYFLENFRPVRFWRKMSLVYVL